MYTVSIDGARNIISIHGVHILYTSVMRITTAIGCNDKTKQCLRTHVNLKKLILKYFSTIKLNAAIPEYSTAIVFYISTSDKILKGSVMCVRPLVGIRMHFKSLHFHSFHNVIFLQVTFTWCKLSRLQVEGAFQCCKFHSLLQY